MLRYWLQTHLLCTHHPLPTYVKKNLHPPFLSSPTLSSILPPHSTLLICQGDEILSAKSWQLTADSRQRVKFALYVEFASVGRWLLLRPTRCRVILAREAALRFFSSVIISAQSFTKPNASPFNISKEEIVKILYKKKDTENVFTEKCVKHYILLCTLIINNIIH